MKAMGIDASAARSPAPGGRAEIVTLKELERRAITHALATLNGNVSLAAKRLGLGRATLYRKMAQYGLMPPGSSEPPP